MTASPRLVIAAPQSGSGKTTFTVGLLQALVARRLRVQPFKIGPDFIDPSHHAAICRRASRNLDTWMCPDDAVLEIFSRAAASAEISVIEGVMGLFDGYSAQEERGSTAHVAKLLRAPVVLVIDAQRSATSAAAVALGFREFDADVQVAGVVFNNVGSAGHYAWLEEALEVRTGLKAFGYILFDPALHIEERHLGLVPAPERAPRQKLYDALACHFAAHVDLDGVIALARAAPELPEVEPRLFAARACRQRVRIGVARDAALHFYYEDNLDLLACNGADIVPFDFLKDECVPPGAQGLYLGGGFPEMFGREIAANVAMKASVRRFAAAGGALYAECGGLMVLCERLIDFDGEGHDMIGLVPAETHMRRDRLSLGYVEAETLKSTVIAEVGDRYRAQTFHYSALENARFEPALRLRHSGRVTHGGYAEGTVLATYAHAHFAGRPQLAERFVARCAAAKPFFMETQR